MDSETQGYNIGSLKLFSNFVVNNNSDKVANFCLSYINSLV